MKQIILAACMTLSLTGAAYAQSATAGNEQSAPSDNSRMKGDNPTQIPSNTRAPRQQAGGGTQGSASRNDNNNAQDPVDAEARGNGQAPTGADANQSGRSTQEAPRP